MATSVCVCLFSELAKSSDVVSNWARQERLRLNRKSTGYGDYDVFGYPATGGVQ